MITVDYEFLGVVMAAKEEFKNVCRREPVAIYMGVDLYHEVKKYLEHLCGDKILALESFYGLSVKRDDNLHSWNGYNKKGFYLA
jgi:hypothetical protein